VITIDKIIYAVLILWIIVLSVLLALSYRKASREKIINVQLENRLSDCEAHITKAEDAVQRQNEAIFKERVDTVILHKELEVVKREYAEKRETIKEVIKDDTSCDKKIEVIDGLMRDFCNGDGGKLQPKNRNKDGR